MSPIVMLAGRIQRPLEFLCLLVPVIGVQLAFKGCTGDLQKRWINPLVTLAWVICLIFNILYAFMIVSRDALVNRESRTRAFKARFATLLFDLWENNLNGFIGLIQTFHYTSWRGPVPQTKPNCTLGNAENNGNLMIFYPNILVTTLMPLKNPFQISFARRGGHMFTK